MPELSKTNALSRNALPGVLQLQPYSPGMPIEELQRNLGLDNVIKMASNENPCGPSPRVKEAIAKACCELSLAHYPDGSGHCLKEKISQSHAISPDCITLGNGSNDILEFVCRIYAGPGRAVMFSEYAFAVYPLATKAQDADAVVVPALAADHARMPYGHDLTGFAAQLKRRDDISLIFIANPNNPTGTWNTAAELLGFLEQVPDHMIVVLDEAYWHYQDPALRPDSREWLRQFNNLIITRTFSKVYGLAGLRVGYALSAPEIADLMNRVRQPFNNNSLALLAAQTALEDQPHVSQSVEINSRERARLKQALEAQGLTVLPSQANFLTVGFGRDASPIHQALLQSGIIVRPMGSYDMPEFLRVTVGREEENTRFLNALLNVL